MTAVSMSERLSDLATKVNAVATVLWGMTPFDGGRFSLGTANVSFTHPHTHTHTTFEAACPTTNTDAASRHHDQCCHRCPQQQHCRFAAVSAADVLGVQGQNCASLHATVHGGHSSQVCWHARAWCCISSPGTSAAWPRLAKAQKSLHGHSWPYHRRCLMVTAGQGSAGHSNAGHCQGITLIVHTLAKVQMAQHCVLPGRSCSRGAKNRHFVSGRRLRLSWTSELGSRSASHHTCAAISSIARLQNRFTLLSCDACLAVI